MSELHPPDEDLSAALDGEAPDVSAHIESCAACAARLAVLRAATLATGQPISVPDSIRDAAVHRALTAGLGQADDRPDRRSRHGYRIMAAAAAVVMAVIAIPVVRSITGGSSSKAASSALAKSPADVAARRSDQATRSAGDLGDVADGASLRQVVAQAVRPPTSAGPATPEVGAAASAAASGGPASTIPGPADAGVATAPRSLIVHPLCDTAVRQSYGTGLGALVVTGDLRWQGTPSVLLVYSLASTGASPLRLRAFVMARVDCRLLVVQSL